MAEIEALRSQILEEKQKAQQAIGVLKYKIDI